MRLQPIIYTSLYKVKITFTLRTYPKTTLIKGNTVELHGEIPNYVLKEMPRALASQFKYLASFFRGWHRLIC